jgi:hypothetical protein
MSNPVENQRSGQQGREKNNKPATICCQKKPSSPKPKPKKKKTQTHTHKPRALKRNRENNHNPQARLLYTQISQNSSLLTCPQYI